MTTTARVHSSNDSHWYDTKGQPCYEIAKKDGSGMRKTTLADARKNNWIPSVTTILGVLDKPGLNAWKIEQAVLSVLTTPRLVGEPDDAFVQRVMQTERVQDQEAATARDMGVNIHNALECFFSGQPVPADMEPWILPAAKEIVKRGPIAATEKILVGDGFAGKTDLVQDAPEAWMLWDYKSTKKLPDPKKGAWTEHVLQLSGYAAALQIALLTAGEKKPIRTANCYISTVEQGKFVICEHDHDWQRTYNQGFRPLVTYWQFINEFKPQQ